MAIAITSVLTAILYPVFAEARSREYYATSVLSFPEGDVQVPSSFPDPPLLEIRLFGTPEIRVCGAPMPPLHSRRGIWVLALLALSGSGPMERSRLAGLLWPNSPESTALHNLRQTLGDLRRALGPAARAIRSDSPRTLGLDLTMAIVDVIAFDAAVDGDQDAKRRAAELYRGPLLQGCDEPWAAEARAEREEAYLPALEGLADDRAKAGDHAGAVRWLRLAVAADPYRESAHRGLMQSLAAAGELTAATEVYRELRIRLHRDLNSEPDTETSALFREIREGAKRSRPSVAVAAGPRAFCPQPLPVPLTELIGRDEALEDIASLLIRRRLVTLTGMGGIGKTRLAVEAARELGSVFEDGTCFVPLAALADPAGVPEAIRQALGAAQADAGLETEELLKQLLFPKRLLLVLDNCEHLLAACATVAEGLLGQCPELRILATSRQALGVGGETLWRVPALSLPPDQPMAPGPDAVERAASYAAVKLFVERAGAADRSFHLNAGNAPAVAGICRRLDGIPLAIELAAARMRSLSACEISARLDDRFRLLTGGSRTAPDRHQTLRAAMDWSYDLLDKAERALFRRLAVFAGGWTLGAAEKVCGCCAEPDRAGDLDVLDALDRLVDKSLVVASTADTDARFSFLETIRQYAWDRLEESGERSLVTKAHHACFLALAEEASPNFMGPEGLQWLDRVAAEHDNMREALARLREDPEGAEGGLRLSAALFQFLRQRGHWTEGRGWYTVALAHPGAQDRTVARAKAAYCAGRLCHKQGDCDAARGRYEEALAILRELGDRCTIAGPLHNLGQLAQAAGRYEEATVLIEEALCINRRSGNQAWEANNLNSLATIALDTDDYHAARRLASESLALFRKLGDLDGASWALGSMAAADWNLGALTSTRALLEESLALRRSTRNKGGIANALMNLSLLACATGALEEARAHMAESFAICLEIGDRRVAACGLESMAHVAQQRGQPQTAARLCGVAGALRKAIDMPLVPNDALQRESLRALRAELGEDVMEREMALGAALSLEEAVELALNDTSASPGC